jgi:Putative zinc-finger
VSDKPDIDKGFERVLSAFLGDELSPPGEECPHPGFLAAYYENRLDGAETERLDRHLAGCRACQEQVAALVRLDPTPTAEVAPAAPLEPVEPLEERRSWGWRWVAAPVALAATALIAVTITHRYAATIGEVSRRAVDSGPREMPVGEAATAARDDATDRSTVSSAAKPDEGGAGTTGGFAAAKPELEGVRADTTAAATEPRPEVPSTRSLDLPDAASAGREGSPTEMTAASATSERTGANGAATEGQQQPRPTAGKLAGARDQALAKAQAAATVPATEDARPVLVTPRSSRKVAWRLRGEAIDRSDDAGTTWRSQASDTAGRLLSGSAPSAKVCWVVGEGGVVLRTTDGEHWVPVESPTEEDLVEIVARNASTAVVEAASGRRFSTRDGGRSWSAP